jgi:hypothetical protein
LSVEDHRSTEILVVYSYSPEMRAARAIMFDLDDADAALTELDLLHAEIAADHSMTGAMLRP